MKTLRNIWFILFSLIWLMVFCGRKLGVVVPGLNSYLTDVLAVPVISTIALAFQRQFMAPSANYCLKAGHILFIVSYTSLIFEFLLPRYAATYTADLWDVFMYAFGGLFFWLVMNRPLRISRQIN